MISLVIVVFIIVVLYYGRLLKYLVYLRNIPGPVPLPLIGNTFSFIFNDHDLINAVSNMIKKYSRLHKVSIGTHSFLIVANAEAAKFIMSSPAIAQKSSNYAFLHNWIGEGIVTGYGDRWRKIRKMVLNKSLHATQLENYMKPFNKISNDLVCQLQQECGNSNFDAEHYLGVFTLEIVIEVVFGIPFNKKEGRSHLDALDGMSKIIMSRLLRPWEHPQWIYQYTGNYRKEEKYMKVIRDFALRAIEERRACVKEHPTTLDILMEAKIDAEPLSNEEIMWEINAALFGGHHTNSAALGFAMYLLAHHEAVQEKVYQEQVDLLIQGDVTVEDLTRMKYLDAVIKEALRLYPPVPVYGRIVSEDTYYPLMDCVLPKGLEVGICAYHIQRDLKYNKDPEEFIPERHFEDNEGMNYVAFSGGVRMCIGQKFAFYEMKTTLSKIVRKYQLIPSKPHVPLKLQADLLLKSTTGYQIRIIDRNK